MTRRPRAPLRPIALAAFVIVTGGASGCEAILGTDRTEETAVLVTDPRLTPDGRGALVVVPDTVGIGVPVTIGVRTAGGGCARRGRTEVTTSDSLVQVRPHTSFPTRNVACTGDFRVIEHVVTRAFATTGLKRIRAIGRTASSGLETVEDSVLVR